MYRQWTFYYKPVIVVAAATRPRWHRLLGGDGEQLLRGWAVVPFGQPCMETRARAYIFIYTHTHTYCAHKTPEAIKILLWHRSITPVDFRHRRPSCIPNEKLPLPFKEFHSVVFFFSSLAVLLLLFNINRTATNAVTRRGDLHAIYIIIYYYK